MFKPTNNYTINLNISRKEFMEKSFRRGAWNTGQLVNKPNPFPVESGITSAITNNQEQTITD